MPGLRGWSSYMYTVSKTLSTYIMSLWFSHSLDQGKLSGCSTALYTYVSSIHFLLFLGLRPKVVQYVDLSPLAANQFSQDRGYQDWQSSLSPPPPSSRGGVYHWQIHDVFLPLCLDWWGGGERAGLNAEVDRVSP